MVNTTYANEAVERCLGINFHMYLCAGPARAYLEDGHGRLLRRRIRATAPETKYFSQKASRRFECAQCESDRVEAVNGHLDRHGTPAPGCTYQLSRIVYQFETLFFGITKRQHQQIICTACLDTIMGNIQIFKTPDPPVESI